MLQEFVLSGAREAAEEVGAMKEPADTSRAEETVSLPLPSLRRLCREWRRRYAARINFPLYPALARRAQTKVAAARLFC
jgi:hypothetical protein